MSDEFTSDIVTEFKENKGSITRGDTTFKLAEYYGFCWGVERAVAMAFQARKHFPDQVHYTSHDKAVLLLLFRYNSKQPVTVYALVVCIYAKVYGIGIGCSGIVDVQRYSRMICLGVCIHRCICIRTDR